MPTEVFAPDLLDGQVALVTGGATGIGLGITRMLSGLGAKVVLASRKQENLERVVAELRANSAEAIAVPTDVRDYGDVQKAVAKCVDTYGALDILVNNAGGNFYCPTADLSPNGWKAVVDIDLNGTFHCCRAAFQPLTRAQQGGRIISLISTHAWTGSPGAAHSAAAKAGIQALSRTLAVEWAQYNILVNTIAPGPIANTEDVRRMAEARGRLGVERARVPLDRLGDVGDVASMVAYLCSPAGAYITGADLVVDGGRWLNYAVVKD